MQYDPIKKDLGSVFNKSVTHRILFYKLLDLLLLRTWHIRKAIRQWKKGIQGEIHILDAGSGFGQYTYFLAKHNSAWKILGVDVKEEQINDCRNFFSKSGISTVEFEIADLTQFVRDNTYDLVLSVDVMEHIEDDVSVFKNLCQSLKPGGLLLISTPSDKGGSDVHQHEYKPGEVQSFIDEHVRDGYNIDEIQQKLIGAGFSRTQAEYAYGWPGKISWKLSMKFPISMLNLSKAFFIVLPFYYFATYWFVLLLNFLDVKLIHTSGTGLVVKAWK
ncbi:MAG: class I SAM-dependent methyltransferase [Bacteroidales bacterium]|nr:class I SAM-dependent methyltransferase [Bacteroidales bacterium]